MNYAYAIFTLGWRHGAIVFYTVMAEANGESLIHRESFGRFIEDQVNKNKIITNAELQEIKQYFLGTINVRRSTQRRISRCGILLKSFAGDADEICVLKEVSLFY